MTGFRKIERELRRLGWTGRHASGDHVKFRKASVVGIIIVSKSLSDGGSSFYNKISEIRRIEPGFMVRGRRRN